MTIKQFAVKYGIPYYVAYKASDKATKVEDGFNGREYEELELLDATRALVKRRLREIRAQYEEYGEMAGKLRRIGC